MDDAEYSTLAGFVLSQLGHIPAAGESFQWRDWRFEVVDLDGRRIDKVLAAHT
jgi:putative hemolysin